jgi:hypothetical protein
MVRVGARFSRSPLRFCSPPTILLMIALLGGCAAEGTRKETPLPFHVALIPFSPDTVRIQQPAGAAGSHSFELALDSKLVSRSVASGLDGTCFARATLLSYPTDVTPEDFEQWPLAKRDAYWVEASEGVGADLVLECELSYSPTIESRANEKFWLNLPLFLLGGPACYFVDDVSYAGEARLNGNIYDLSAIRGDHATLEDGRAQILHVESRFQEASLDFLDRAGGNVGSFAASLLIPAGFLSRENETAEHHLALEVADDLSRGLARAIREGSHEVLVADRLAGFHLDPHYDLKLENDVVHFQGEVVLRRAEQERMESYSIHVGENSVSGEFAAGSPDRIDSSRRAQYLRFPFRAEIPLSPSADRLVIQLTAGGANPGVRSFTIPLPKEWRRQPSARGTVSSIRP